MALLRLTPFARALLGLALPGVALAGPTGGQVVSGNITIGVPDPLTTVVDQTSHTGIVNWQSFSVGSDESVLFNLPGASSSILNRVVGGNASEILGHMQSNGRVFLLNPNGVLFGAGSSVDVGSLFTSTFDIDNADFLAGRYEFENRGGTGSVENRGRIHVADGGFVVMTAEQVTNSGLIQARLGDVQLASGSAVTMDLDGNGLVNLQVTEAALSEVAGVTNVGEIIADGGRVAMTARVARQLAGTVVNNQGVVRARGISESGNGIFLTASGGDIENSGTLDVSGTRGHDAGEARLIGDGNVALTDASRILATGDHGVAEVSGNRVRIRGDVRLGDYGAFYIDPTDLIVGEDASADLLVSDLESLLQSGPGSSTVYVVASNSILFLDVAGNLIDGTNGGSGANLLVGIGFVDGGFFQGLDGSVAFQDAADEIRVDGGISILSGSESGTLDIGALTATGDIVVNGAEAVSVGTVTASGADIVIGSLAGSVVAGDLTGRSVGVTAGNGIAQAGAVDAGKGGASITSWNTDVGDDVGGPVGGIIVDSITSGGGVELTSLDGGAGGLGIGVTVNGATQAKGFVGVLADSGDVTLGDVRSDTRGTDTGAVVQINAVGRIATGNLDILGGDGGASAFWSSSGDLTIDGHATLRGAGAVLALDAGGAVQVTGPVSLTGTGTASSFEGEGVSISIFDGGARFNVSGQDVDLLGDLTLRAVGSTTAEIVSETDITIAGDTRLVSTPASIETTTTTGSGTITTIERNGTARLQMLAGLGTPSTISTGDIVVSGPDAQVFAEAGQVRTGALRATALPGGIESGAYYREDRDGVTVAESTVGVAVISLLADQPTSGPGVIVNGDLSAQGPLAIVTLLSADGVTVAGSVDVTGFGYTATGDLSSLPSSGFIAGNHDIPRLDQGTLNWGSATLDVSGNDGFVSMDGVSIDGVGQSSASIVAGSASLGAVSVTASDGLVDGSYVVQETIGGQSYLVTHRIDDGAGGAAHFAGAHFELAFSGANANLDSLVLSGTDVEATIDGPGAVAIAGDVTLTGATPGSAPTVRERVSYADDPFDSPIAPALANTSTTVTGGRVLFGVGFLGEIPSSFSSGDITMSGAGVTGLSVAAGATTIGAIDLSASAGGFVTNDAIHNEGVDPGEKINDGLGHVFVAIGSPNDPAAIESLTVDAAGDVFLGVQADASGDVAIAAAGALRAATPDELVALANPIQSAMDQNIGGDVTTARIPPKLDLPLQGTNLSGANVSLDFGADSTVGDLTLESTGTLAVNGDGADLSSAGGAGTIKLDAGQALTLTDVGLEAGSLQLAGSEVRLGGAHLVGGDVLMTARAGGVTDQGQAFTIVADSLGVLATSSILLSSGTMSIGTGETSIGGDPGLLAQLLALGLPVPDAGNPNASFVGSSVNIGGLTLAGDYLFLQGDQVSAGFTAPDDLTLQFVPNTPDASLGLENAPAGLRDVNLNVEANFPDLASATVIIGSSTYGGDINVGENGTVTPPPGTDVVLVTSGSIVRPSRIVTIGTVITIGDVVEDPAELPGQDEVESVQNDPTPTGQPQPPTLPIPQSEQELIDQTTDTGPDLVCT